MSLPGQPAVAAARAGGPPGGTSANGTGPAPGTDAFHWWVPAQRTGHGQPDSAPTVVIPYVGSARSHRTRFLRAWMFTLPVDVLTLLAPLVWSRTHWKAIVVAAVFTIALFATGGLYQPRRHLSFLDVLPGLAGRTLVASSLVSIFVAERHDSLIDLGGFLRQAAVASLAVLAGRAVSLHTHLVTRRRRWVERGALIVGGGPVAIELARLLRRYPQYGLRFMGFVDLATTAHGRQESMPLVGHLDELETMVGATDCEVVIIADVDCGEARLTEIARSSAMRGCDIWVVPRLREFHTHNGVPDHIGAIPVSRVRRPVMAGPRWMVKRACDIVFAATALVVLSPVLLLCAVATFLEGGRGIFFYQQRVGRDGRPFRLVKFRSMRPGTDAEAQTTWSVAHDPRIGPVGRFMRRTSLDEIPQLWNILRGDMTLVGPRPERPYFVDRFSADYPDYAMRHRVPVGLTGLAQVSGLRGDTPISDRARFDNYYIENWSLWLDFKVIMRTLAEVLRGRGR